MKSASEWIEVLRQAGVPCGPINDVGQVVNDPHVNARNMIIESEDARGRTLRMAGNPIKLSGVEDVSRRPAAPELG